MERGGVARFTVSVMIVDYRRGPGLGKKKVDFNMNMEGQMKNGRGRRGFLIKIFYFFFAGLSKRRRSAAEVSGGGRVRGSE